MPPRKRRAEKKTAGSASKSATESDVAGAEGAEADRGAVNSGGAEANRGSREESKQVVNHK